MDVCSLLGCEGKPNNKAKLFFLPCAADNPTNSCHEIPEVILFRSLLNENADSAIKETNGTCKLVQIPRGIDHESKISQVETHRQKKISVSNSTFGIFLVFQTVGEMGHFWWSLETYQNHVVIQRSRDKDEVKNQLKGETREGIQLIADKLEGKGCMRQLLTLLWIHMIVDAKCQRFLSRCESVIPLVIQKITKIGYEYETDFTYSALSAEERNPDLSDIINFLLNVSNWHPLVVATYLGDTELLDRLKKDGQYNINGVYSSFTLLNLAILFAKTETVQHLLGQMKADPTRRDEKGRNALHMAAKFNREKKIIEIFLNKTPIDQCDAKGTTALNHAIMTSNTEIVQCLLDNGADPKKQDQIGRWPLHVAAFYATDTNIIDILLQKKEIIDVNDCDKFGVTALHNAAMASNSKMARHLLANGANINCRDKEGLTPLHVAVTFAKDIEMIDLFLDNKQVNLHCCDKLGQNVIAYAQKNTYGLREKIIDCLKEIDDGVIKEYYLLKLAKSEMHIPIWKSLINNLSGYFSNNNFTFQTSHPSELFYVPYADLKPGKGSEISESVLIWYIANKASRKQRNFPHPEMPGSIQLLNDIDHDSQITEIQIYNRSKNNSATHLTRAFSFVFKTTSKKDGEHWWSLERNVNYVVLQRSRDTDAVKNKCGGKNRKEVEPNVKILIENGSIKNISHQNPMLDLKHFLTNMYKWHPLFLAIYFGNARLFERTKEMAKLDKEFTLLNSERTFSNRKEMVFQEKQKADPTTRDATGRNALATAAIHADNAEVLDLLLKHENVKMDGFERSALHFDAISPNIDVAKHLIKTGEKPNSLDSNGLTPLHLAAYHSDDTEMIDLLLEAQKQSQGDERIDNLNKHDGITALHSAAIASNEITAKHLIERGADPDRKDKFGRTPLHLAALFAKNTKIIDVFLNNKQVDVNALDYSGQNALYYAQRNQYGQTRKILSRVKGIGSMNRGNNTTALNLAIQYSTEMVKFLFISVLPYSLHI